MTSQEFEELLQAVIEVGGSDLHLKVGSPPMMRMGNELLPCAENPLSAEAIETIARFILQQSYHIQHLSSHQDLREVSDIDLSYSLSGWGRFRVNIARQRGTFTITMRVIPLQVKSVKDWGLPEVLEEIALEPRGLILVTGVTGSGKSSTLAAMLDHINTTLPRKIITIEDPIEFLIPDKRGFVVQRELGSDTVSFATALRSALRQNPDVIMVGELRDRETVEIALKAAETGHTVFSTLHTPNAEGSILRIIGTFEPGERDVVRRRVADVLKAVISQRLVPRADGKGRVAAVEILRMTLAIRERILNADPRGFQDLIEEGWHPYRMQTFDRHLTHLYQAGIITLDTALAYATSPTDLKRNLMFDNR